MCSLEPVHCIYSKESTESQSDSENTSLEPVRCIYSKTSTESQNDNKKTTNTNFVAVLRHGRNKEAVLLLLRAYFTTVFSTGGCFTTDLSVFFQIFVYLAFGTWCLQEMS